jgi:ABC-type multidrug transport system fused ATPase/permease subunit
MGGRTTLIIAHRLSSLHHAQRIVILEQGQISEEGTHQDLVAGNGLYRRLYEIQTLAQTT